MIHRYPYTDFNEYNLDWCIERVKELTSDWLETREEWTGTKAEWTALYNYVHDYFDNLDVSQEVGQIIDDYRQDGTLAVICQPIVDHWVEDNVPGQLDSWLNSHVTQETGYVLDSSLTLANAAAPAKTVGDALSDVNDALDDFMKTNNTVEAFYDYYINFKNFRVGGNVIDPDVTNRASATIISKYVPLTISIDSTYMYALYYYDSTDTLISTVGWRSAETTTPTTAYKILVQIKKVSEETIAPSEYSALYNALTVKCFLGNYKNILYGGSYDYDYSALLETGSNRMYIRIPTFYGDVKVTCNDSDYYMFLYNYDEENTEIENSVSWQSDFTYFFKNPYMIQITIKKGSAGTDLFTDSDVTALLSSLTVTVSYKGLLKNKPVYVSTAGNDSTGTGTKIHPFRSLGKALEVSNDVIIEAGSYTESVSVKNIENISIRADLDKANNTDKVVFTTSGQHVLSILNCSNVYIDGIVFDGANHDVVVINKCNHVLLQGCEFNNSVVANGLNFDKSDGIVIGCNANSNYNDGFNIHYYGNSNFYNCNADDNGGDGVSHHENCTGSVVGGYWTNNGKAGISTPTYGAKVNVSDAICSGNLYGMQVYGDEYVIENTVHIKLSNIVFLNNSIAGLQSDKYIIDLVNCVFSGNTTDFNTVSGTVNTFNS